MGMILQWYRGGGPFIVPLAIIGVAGLLLLADRVVHIVLRSKIHARPFMEKVISLTRAGKLEEALKLCTEHQSALPDLGLVILRSRTSDERDLLHVAETATLTVVPLLTRRLAWLPTLAQIALLVGILGGVANMHDSLGRQQSIALGLAYALRPLAVGLLTAIPF